jgi:hypothetical protein
MDSELARVIISIRLLNIQALILNILRFPLTKMNFLAFSVSKIQTPNRLLPILFILERSSNIQQRICQDNLISRDQKVCIKHSLCHKKRVEKIKVWSSLSSQRLREFRGVKTELNSWKSHLFCQISA